MALPIYPMVDALLHGRLHERLEAGRSEGKTVREIADEITGLLPEGIKVSATTVHRWCEDIPKVEVPS